MTLGKWLMLLRSFLMAELFKLRRSRVAKATTVVTAIASPIVIGITWLLLGDEGITTFPRVLELIYIPLWLLTGFLGLSLAIETMGNEYEQGTVRTVMGRGTPRWLFVGGKAIALLIVLASNTIVGTLCGGAFATVGHLSQLGTAGLAEGLGGFAQSCLPAMGIVTLSGWAYVGILLLVVVLVRSSALAMLCGLLVFGGDFIVEAIGTRGFDLGAYSILRNTFTLLFRIVGKMSIIGNPDETTDPRRAFLTLSAYAAVGIGVACYIFQRQDLAGKR